MGWFWADTPRTATPVAPHPFRNPRATPPVSQSVLVVHLVLLIVLQPECPMHNATAGSFPPQKSRSPPSNGSCAVDAPNAPLPSSTSNTSAISKLNPLNYMPSNISQSRAENQTINLPKEREISSIPRGDVESNWEYPSPQQMYNAMIRKGYDDTPQDAVESMVAVHNFLNEGAWAEIVGWEQRFSRGLICGWRACSKGEEGFPEAVPRKDKVVQPKLLRFQGRPGDTTPKAKLLRLLGEIYPARFGCVQGFPL